MKSMSPKFRAFLAAMAVLLLLAFLAATATPVYAGNAPKSPPGAASSSSSGAAAGAVAGSVSGARSSSEGGDAAAHQRQAARSEAHGGAGGNGIGTVEGDSSRFRSTAVALSVPGATAAPAVIADCIEHSRGWQAGMGVAARSGGTKLQKKCMDRAHCLAIADRYSAMGLPQAAVDQLASCGGVPGVVIVTAPPVVPDIKGEVPPTDGASSGQPAAASPAELAALEQRMIERMDRQHLRGQGK